MRASRLLTIQMLLQTRGRMPAQALADALEVSLRTLYRDIDELTAAGVPVVADRGRHGGFRLLDGWQTTLTGLTPHEAQAVFLGGLAGPAAQLGLGQAMQAAQLKLLSTLPAAWRDDARRVALRLHLDPVDWYREAEPVPHLGTVAQAVWQQRQLALHYDSWQAVVRRTVHPLGLVLKAGTWYLVAAVGGAPRTFRVASMQDAQLLDAAVQPPAGFDLAAHWAASTARFERDLYRGQAQVLATAQGLRQLRWMNATVARAVAAAPPSRRRDGRTALSIPVEAVAQAAPALLRLAPEVEVQGPPELRAAIQAQLRQAWALYA